VIERDNLLQGPRVRPLGMVTECDCVRFRTVAKTVAELWLELGPKYEGGVCVRQDGVGMRMPLLVPLWSGVHGGSGGRTLAGDSLLVFAHTDRFGGRGDRGDPGRASRVVPSWVTDWKEHSVGQHTTRSVDMGK
jgi:hypothetical protein